MEYVVGKDMVSFCGRCKLSLAHLIMALKDPMTPAKLKCKTCGSIHAPRAEKKVVNKSTTRSVVKRTTTVSASEMWANKMAKSTKRAQAYSTQAKYQTEDLLDHPQFGIGFVYKILDSKKMEVLFQREIKTLVYGL
jgi:DNA-directed RNA polymerase subunit M/transcription elongation factor TFIIS